MGMPFYGVQFEVRDVNVPDVPVRVITSLDCATSPQTSEVLRGTLLPVSNEFQMKRSSMVQN